MSGASSLDWYIRRVRGMSAAEAAGRVGDQARQRAWRRRQVRVGEPMPPPPGSRPGPPGAPLPPGASGGIPDRAGDALLEAAEMLLGGTWEVLGVVRHDLVRPDWFLDPVTGRRAPQVTYAFDVNHRSQERTGNVKQVWELSRHHHLTLLAAAWRLAGDDRYAALVDSQLRSWWRENPTLSGIHWTSGIELGIRLVSWAWIRRLLDGWPGAADLFEANPMAVAQVAAHQGYLDAFRSKGSSANNHVIAEAAGQLVASCAFPWFPESAGRRARAASLLERELERNTFASGLNREQATGYHGFVAELGLVAAIEAEASGHPLGEATWRRLCAMVDAAAAIVDEQGRPPRQGDGDDGQVLLVDAPSQDRWRSVLALGGAMFGPLPWWPAVAGDVRSALVASLVPGGRPCPDGRPEQRPSHFADAGMTILRTAPGPAPELWCRCDAGPHGFLSIAAHAHADALSVEVRHGGVDVLADPGTYCYHGEPEWRAWFRSTLGHNTIELAGRDQSEPGGPFLWSTHAGSRTVDLALDDGPKVWRGEHDGYRRLHPPATHRRTVTLDADARQIEIRDQIECGAPQPCRAAFHLGPAIDCTLDGTLARLAWSGPTGVCCAVVELAPGLDWRTYRGSVDPVRGWYSGGFGRRSPSVTLIGSGHLGGTAGELVTTLRF